MFFYPADISHFPPFGCHLGSQLGSLRQKCDPDKCYQNSHKSRLCFITQQTFPIFIPLAVTWCPNLDPCGRSVVLTGAIENHIKVVYGFLPIRHFPCPFLWVSLGVPARVLATSLWWGYWLEGVLCRKEMLWQGLLQIIHNSSSKQTLCCWKETSLRAYKYCQKSLKSEVCIR